MLRITEPDGDGLEPVVSRRRSGFCPTALSISVSRRAVMFLQSRPLAARAFLALTASRNLFSRSVASPGGGPSLDSWVVVVCVGLGCAVVLDGAFAESLWSQHQPLDFSSTAWK